MAAAKDDAAVGHRVSVRVSSPPPTSSCPSSTIPSPSVASPPPTPSATFTPWAGGPSWRCLPSAGPSTYSHLKWPIGDRRGRRCVTRPAFSSPAVTDRRPEHLRPLRRPASCHLTPSSNDTTPRWATPHLDQAPGIVMSGIPTTAQKGKQTEHEQLAPMPCAPSTRLAPPAAYGVHAITDVTGFWTGRPPVEMRRFRRQCPPRTSRRCRCWTRWITT